MPATAREKAATQLESMARSEFGELSSAEVKVLTAAALWAVASCGPSTNLTDPSNNPEHSLTWGAEREVRAEMIRWLCVNSEAKALVDPAGVRLVGARVSGELDLSYAEVKFPLSMNHCRFTSRAHLEGSQLPFLDLDGSWTVGIGADSAIFKQGLYLRKGFKSDGEISLTGAQTRGDLDCSESAFISQSGKAISASRAVVGGDVRLDGGEAKGTINLIGANVGGDVVFDGGRFTKSGGDAIVLQRAAIKGGIFFGTNEGHAFRVNGNVDLTGASAGALGDDRQSWPNKLGLEGFVYERILGGPRDAASRLEWLKLDTSGSNQPYRQLAKVLQDSGDRRGARSVLIRLDRNLTRFWLRPLMGLIAYGHRPVNALWGLAALTLFGALLYRQAGPTITPTDKDAYQSVASKSALPANYPRFQPFIFSLENTFPLVKLGQADKWQADPEPQAATRPVGNVWRRLLAYTASSVFIRRFIWTQILLGWLLATLFLAAISGIVQHG